MGIFYAQRKIYRNISKVVYMEEIKGDEKFVEFYHQNPIHVQDFEGSHEAALQNIKDEKEREKKNVIWDYDEKRKKSILNHKIVAHILMEEFFFITVGDKVNEIYYYQDGMYKRGGEKIIGQRVEELTGGNIRTNDVSEIQGHIQRLTYMDRSILDTSNINFICVGNGILNIRTLELLPYSEKIIFTQKLKWNYNPKSDCPKIKQFFKDIVKDNDVDIIQEFIGYLLYRVYFIKKALILVGEPDTGKTTFIKLVINFIGQENTSGVSLHKILTDKFASSHLYNKLLNFYDDLSFRDIKQTGDFKIATGSGYITGEKKFGDQFQFLNYAKLLFATNKISAVEDVSDDAYYNRWIILFFNNEFDDENEKTDKNIITKLVQAEEMEGLLNWALEGLKRLLENQQFSYKLAAEENKLIMERSSNTISCFAQDILVEEPNNWISKEMMYKLYSIYVNNYGGARVTKEKFGRDLPTKVIYIMESRKDTEKKKSAHGWLNVAINTTNTSFLQILYNKINDINDINSPIAMIKRGISSISTTLTPTEPIGFKITNPTYLPCKSCGATHSKGWTLQKDDGSIWCDACVDACQAFY